MLYGFVWTENLSTLFNANVGDLLSQETTQKRKNWFLSHHIYSHCYLLLFTTKISAHSIYRNVCSFAVSNMKVFNRPICKIIRTSILLEPSIYPQKSNFLGRILGLEEYTTPTKYRTRSDLMNMCWTNS